MEVIAFALAEGAWSSWVWPLLQFIIGLGVVVFFHELGHFLVAKAVNIKVEKFALGFGPKVLGVRLGETEYSLRLLPLGGYVKMLGQEDVAPLTEEQAPDPRSYQAKSVGARLAVVSAGVVMNALLALVVFVVIAMIGREYPSPVLGEVRKHFPAATCTVRWQDAPPGSPATSVGLRPGDRPIRIEGEGLLLGILGPDVPHFQRLALLSIIADPDDTFRLTFQRDVDGNTWTGTAELGVRMAADPAFGGRRLSFGIGQATTNTVVFAAGSKPSARPGPFRDEDELIEVAGRPLRHPWELSDLLADVRSPTVPVRVRRDGNAVALTAPRVVQCRPHLVYLADGTRLDAEDYSIGTKTDGEREMVVFRPLAPTDPNGPKEIVRPREEVTFAAADEILDLFGMVPRLRVTGIVEGSAADDANLLPGDIIVHYADTPCPTLEDLRRISAKVGRAGGTARLTVLRNGRRLEGIPIRPRWDRKRNGALIGIFRHVDLAHPVVAAVRKGSPVDRANRAAETPLQTGAVLEKVNDRPVTSWLDVFDALRDLAGREVALTFRGGPADTERHTLTLGTLDAAAFDPADYELSVFDSSDVGLHAPAMVTLKESSLGGAVAWALRETCGQMVTTYASLRSILKGTVSTKGVMGPVGLGAFAVKAARSSLMDLVWLMASLSAILAVMNFLPLPVVDGGHAVFLILEKIRGRPLPVRVMNAIQMTGLVLILGLFVAITYQDIMRLLF